jgi:hypothetical protein
MFCMQYSQRGALCGPGKDFAHLYKLLKWIFIVVRNIENLESLFGIDFGRMRTEYP